MKHGVGSGHGGAMYGGFKGEYMAPAHKASTVRGSFMSDDSVGVRYGLGTRADFDSEYIFDFEINNQVSNSGNPRSSIVGPRGTKSMQEKGHTFTMC
jgi:hypothetical protein